MGKSNILQRGKKCLTFNFQDVQIGGRDKILSAPQRGRKIIVNQTKPILVVVSIKPFTCQMRFRQNYFSLEIEWDCACLLDTEANGSKMKLYAAVFCL